MTITSNNDATENTVSSLRFKDQRFLTLLLDCLVMHQMAVTNANNSLVLGAATRASVYSAALIMECAANACITDLKLPKKLEEDIEKTTPIFKYEYYLFSKCSVHLDRSTVSFCRASEVIKLRNHIVHPSRINFMVGETGESEYGEFQGLGIPKDIRAWLPEHSQIIIDTVSIFLHNFFIKQCQHDPGSLTSILCKYEFSKRSRQGYAEIHPKFYDLINSFAKNILETVDLRLGPEYNI